MLASKITDELVISTIAGISMQWQSIKPRDGNLYGIYMTGATSLALGLSKALPHRRVISLDGDGSMLMGLSILPAIAQQNPANLIVIVFDNESYEAAGKVPTFTSGGTDLVEIARGAGIGKTWEVREPQDFLEVIEKAYESESASFINIKVDLSPPKPKRSFRMNFGLIENKYRFLRYIEKTENR
jgi:thiamine pyrophosphate-dependent acetolactate synthase large subunit-like protein